MAILDPDPDRTRESNHKLIQLVSGLDSDHLYGINVGRCDFFDQQGNRFRLYEEVASPSDVRQLIHGVSRLEEAGLGFYERPGLSVHIEIFPSAFDAPDGVLPLPAADEPPLGDHAVLAIAPFEFNGSKDALLIMNPWGEDWGAEGFGVVTREYLDRYFSEAWVLRHHPGPLVSDYAVPFQPLAANSADAWDAPLENHAGSGIAGCLWFENSDIRMVSERFTSLVTGGEIERVRLDVSTTDAAWLTVGWMHVGLTQSETVIEDFFVWPPYRERGLGTMLASHVLMRAAIMQRRVITWKLPKADQVSLDLAAAPPRYPAWFRSLSWAPVGAPRDQDAGICGRVTTVSSLDLLQELAESQA